MGTYMERRCGSCGNAVGLRPCGRAATPGLDLRPPLAKRPNPESQKQPRVSFKQTSNAATFEAGPVVRPSAPMPACVPSFFFGIFF